MELTIEQLKARIAELEAEKKAKQVFKLKVSEKGAVSIYGLQRFPVTLYKAQMATLLEHADEIRKFMRDHDAELSTK